MSDGVGCVWSRPLLSAVVTANSRGTNDTRQRTGSLSDVHLKKLIAIIIKFCDGLKENFRCSCYPLDLSVVSHFSALFCFINTASNSFYETSLKSTINAKDITSTQVQRSETAITNLFQENSYVYDNMDGGICQNILGNENRLTTTVAADTTVSVRLFHSFTLLSHKFEST